MSMYSLCSVQKPTMLCTGGGERGEKERERGEGEREGEGREGRCRRGGKRVVEDGGGDNN